MVATFDFPTRIRFGEGAVRVLAEELTDRGLEHVLVVTDPGVVAAGLLKIVEGVLDDAGIAHTAFDGVQTNPEEKDLHAGVSAWRDAGADAVVALGGGAAMDTAKGVRLLATHPGPLAQYDDAKGGARFISADLPPLIAIPTTAGTGSEVGRSLVVTLEETRKKTVIFSPHLMPTVALCDPDLTRGLPPKVTAATGMDALTHNLEAYLAKGFHPLADAIGIRGVSLVQRYLARAVEYGEDMEARTGMMSAALMGAVAFQKGLGVSHSLAHALGAVCGLHHGLANALVLPAVLRFDAGAVPERVADVATALGASGAGYGDAPGDRAANRVIELRADAGLPASLTEAGVDPGRLPDLVAAAQADACHLSGPRPVTAKDLTGLFQASFGAD